MFANSESKGFIEKSDKFWSMCDKTQF